MVSKSGTLKFYADVFAWFTDGQIKKISLGDGIYYQACIHPEGTHVSFSGNSSGAPRIWKGDLDTGKILPLSPQDSGARHGVFSWDGKKIVFSSDMASGQPPERMEEMSPAGTPPQGQTLNIFVMDSDGNNIRQITRGSFQDQRPCISPDGKHIAFVSNRAGPYPGLWVIPTEGEKEPEPLITERWAYRPWYSVDGTSIYFFSVINERRQICQIPADGGNFKPLANDDKGNSHGPFADPSGEYLLMHSTRGGSWGLWELPLDGSPPRSIQPSGFEHATHPTRAKNGIIAFDVVRFAK
jgi:TolB protein